MKETGIYFRFRFETHRGRLGGATYISGRDFEAMPAHKAREVLAEFARITEHMIVAHEEMLAKTVTVEAP